MGIPFGREDTNPPVRLAFQSNSHASDPALETACGLSKTEQRQDREKAKLPHRIAPVRLHLAYLPEEICAPAFFGSGRMPAFQSVSELDVSAKYHLKAIGCEQHAVHATDQATEQAWRVLAAQWHAMADRAAKLLDDPKLTW